MIKFVSDFTVKGKEKKKIAKKDGGTFEFVEVLLEAPGKKPVHIATRAMPELEDEIAVGAKGKFEIGISSTDGGNGRYWYNFVILSINLEKPAQPIKPLETELMTDDIPF